MLDKRKIGNLFGVTVFLILAYFVFWQTYVETLIDLPQSRSASLVQPNPRAGAALLRSSVTSDGRSLISDKNLLFERMALGNRLTPLHPYPYIWKSRELAAKKKFAEAIDLLEYAKKRNPRSYSVRRLLAEYYLLTNDVEESLQEMFSSAILNPDWGTQFMEAVRILGNNPDLQPRVIEQIASEPDWTNRFFAKLDPEKADDPFVIKLSEKVPPNARYRDQLTARLAARGLYENALSLWLQSIGTTQEKIAWPYDNEFDALAGSGPFNWTIRNSANARAQLSSSSAWPNENALYVFYFGGKRSTIVRQTMMNKAGHYTYSIPYSVGMHEGQTTRLKWRVRCIANNKHLGEVLLDHNGTEEGILRLEFDVPRQDCSAQELLLLGEASGRTGQMDVEFRRFDIAPREQKPEKSSNDKETPRV